MWFKEVVKFLGGWRRLGMQVEEDQVVRYTVSYLQKHLLVHIHFSLRSRALIFASIFLGFGFGRSELSVLGSRKADGANLLTVSSQAIATPRPAIVLSPTSRHCNFIDDVLSNQGTQTDYLCVHSLRRAKGQVRSTTTLQHMYETQHRMRFQRFEATAQET